MLSVYLQCYHYFRSKTVFQLKLVNVKQHCIKPGPAMTVHITFANYCLYNVPATPYRNNLILEKPQRKKVRVSLEKLSNANEKFYINLMYVLGLIDS